MIKNDFFLFERLKDFITLNYPPTTKKEQVTIRKLLFTSDSFLSYRLPDRCYVFKNAVSEPLSTIFLTYLYNCEIDFMKDDLMLLYFDGQIGPPNMILTMAAIEASEYRLSSKVLKAFAKKIQVIHEIGYEHHYFSLYDELVFHICIYNRCSFDDVLEFYGKTRCNLIENEKSYKLEARDVKNSIELLFNESFDVSPSMQLRLLIKLIRSKLVIDPLLNYDGLVKDGVVYIKPKDGSQDYYKKLLLHEACHILMKYEERYNDFRISFEQYVETQHLFSSWYEAKEKCVDFKVNLYCNYNRSKHSLNIKNNSGLIMNDAIINLKQKTRKDSLTWT